MSILLPFARFFYWAFLFSNVLQCIRIHFFLFFHAFSCKDIDTKGLPLGSEAAEKGDLPKVGGARVFAGVTRPSHPFSVPRLLSGQHGSLWLGYL